MSNFLEAARSYFGLAEVAAFKCEWRTIEGRLVMAVEFTPTDDDMLGIAERMKAMREVETPRCVVVEDEIRTMPDLAKVEHEAGAEYDAMTKQERGGYGARWKYIEQRVADALGVVRGGR